MPVGFTVRGDEARSRRDPGTRAPPKIVDFVAQRLDLNCNACRVGHAQRTPTVPLALPAVAAEWSQGEHTRRPRPATSEHLDGRRAAQCGTAELARAPFIRSMRRPRPAPRADGEALDPRQPA